MKARSKEELAAFVDKELAWRRKELTSIAAMVSEARQHAKVMLLRAGVALLYAHWEGFVREAANAYCTYVRHRGVALGRLRESFVAVVVRNSLRGSPAGKRIAPYLEVVDVLLNDPSSSLRLPAGNVIDTESNLTFDVFADIAITIGVDTAPYETKAHLIDQGLVEQRHKIAHGARLEINSDSFDEVRREVLWCMELFRTQVQNAAEEASYLRGDRAKTTAEES